MCDEWIWRFTSPKIKSTNTRNNVWRKLLNIIFSRPTIQLFWTFTSNNFTVYQDTIFQFLWFFPIVGYFWVHPCLYLNLLLSKHLLNFHLVDSLLCFCFLKIFDPVLYLDLKHWFELLLANFQMIKVFIESNCDETALRVVVIVIIAEHFLEHFNPHKDVIKLILKLLLELSSACKFQLNISNSCWNCSFAYGLHLGKLFLEL